MGVRMHVKELPRRIEGCSVVKGVFLGWLNDFRQEGGYFAYCLTYGVTDVHAGDQYQAHVMWSDGLDKPWRRIESRVELSVNEALSAFTEHEELAVWPEGN